MAHPTDDETALIVLRRPGPATISDADTYIFRVMREAAADRETTPWAFYVTGPDGVQQVTDYDADPPSISASLARLARPGPPAVEGCLTRTVGAVAAPGVEDRAAFRRKRSTQLRMTCKIPLGRTSHSSAPITSLPMITAKMATRCRF